MLFPYLNGEDLNSTPDSAATRWVIDFNDRTEDEASRYELPYSRLLNAVKPERQRKKPDGTFALRRPLPERWWQYGEKRPAMRRAIADLSEVLVIARVSKTVMPLRVRTGQIMSEACVVFATDDYCDQAVLSSSLHQLWAITYGSTLETRVRYTPSDVFETLPLAKRTSRLEEAGKALENGRREIMMRRSLGLTKLYNLVNDETIHNDRDVDQLRDIHVEIDQAAIAAYGWDDIHLSHEFGSYRGVVRWSISTSARLELMDRLLECNHIQARSHAPIERR